MKLPLRLIASIVCAAVLLTALCLGLSVCAYDVNPMDKMGLVVTESSDLNIRSGPGTEYGKVTALPKGTIVNITGSSNDTAGDIWYKIAYNNVEGFGKGEYFTVFDRPTEGDDAFETELTLQGFPESYKEGLRLLHALHPEWKFTALQTGLTWQEVVAAECLLGRNLVSSSSLASWKSFEKGAYDWDNNEWYSFDSGGWKAASKEVICYYLDPRNFLDNNIFQFLELSYNADMPVSEEAIKAAFSGTFMTGDLPDGSMSYARGVLEAAKAGGANPFMLAARLRLEQGAVGNKLAHGTVAGSEGYYNHFDIGAYASGGRTAMENGAIYAKNKGWDTPLKALTGGASFLTNSYIKVGQNTLYLQKFDVVDGGNGYYSHQYMTNTSAAVSECSSLRNAVSTAGAMDSALNFIIPVYKDMPEEKQPKPTSTGNNNNWLETLSIAGHSFTQPYQLYTTEYEAFVDTSVITVNAAAKDSGAVISGTGEIRLKYGINEIKVTVTAPSGSQRVYTLYVTCSVDSGGEGGGEGDETFQTSYPVKSALITGVSEGTLLRDFKQNITVTGYTAVFADASGAQKNDGDLMKTGDRLVLRRGEEEVRAYSVVIYGDSNGDGRITSGDLLKIQRHILSIQLLNAGYLEASDMNGDGRITSGDLLLCQRRILGL